MKKGDIVKAKVIEVNFPNRGIAEVTGEEGKIAVEGVIKGQEVEVQIKKKKKDRYEAKLVNVCTKGEGQIDPKCPHFGMCGGCTYQHLEYAKQLEMKETQVKNILSWNRIDVEEFMPIEGSPDIEGYRNKMEFSFGNAEKDGELTLGMHRKASMHDIVATTDCNIVDEDFTAILKLVLDYCRENELTFYHKMTHEGFLRHLVIRKGTHTGDILVNIVTTSQMKHDFEILVDLIMRMELKGQIRTILHCVNDKVSDVVAYQKMTKLTGDDFIMDNILGLDFKISPFSFFQTNTRGAEKLYSIVKDFVGSAKGKKVFDLYCGTGTIAMAVSREAENVIGVEIVEEAVDMANENKTINEIDNVEFIAGDVKEVIKGLESDPDIIILDPPRDGIHGDALADIIEFNAKEIVYVSCNPKSLARDLIILQEAGYKVNKVKCMDMFPMTTHVETVVALSK